MADTRASALNVLPAPTDSDRIVGVRASNSDVGLFTVSNLRTSISNGLVSISGSNSISGNNVFTSPLTLSSGLSTSLLSSPTDSSTIIGNNGSSFGHFSFSNIRTALTSGFPTTSGTNSFTGSNTFTSAVGLSNGITTTLLPAPIDSSTIIGNNGNSFGHFTVSNLRTVLTDGLVSDTGNETIAGIKTFSNDIVAGDDIVIGNARVFGGTGSLSNKLNFVNNSGQPVGQIETVEGGTATTGTGRRNIDIGLVNTSNTGDLNSLRLYEDSLELAAGNVVLSNDGGITFGLASTTTTTGSLSTSKTLDDYEEGAWTPDLQSSRLSATAVGTYTKIGNTVTIVARFTNTSSTGFALIIIEDLPFTPSTNNANTGGVSIWGVSGGNFFSNSAVLTNNRIEVISLTADSFTTADFITVSITYQTTA